MISAQRKGSSNFEDGAWGQQRQWEEIGVRAGWLLGDLSWPQRQQADIGGM